MPRRIIERIRDNIRQQQYDMTAHAMEEMAEDDLDIIDSNIRFSTEKSFVLTAMISEAQNML